MEAGSFDVREMYPFRYDPNEHFLGRLGEFTSMLDEEINVGGIEGIASKLKQSADALPHPSSVRDYLIETALFPMLSGDQQFADVSTAEKLAIFQSAYEIAHTARTKGTLGRQIAEIRLGELGNNLTFEDGLRVILETMPARSTSRDHLILNVLNNTYATWGQINRAEVLLLGNEYSTNESASATRSITNEAIFRKMQDMSIEERDEFVFFLLDRTKHVLKPEDLTEGFFDDKVREKIKRHVVGRYEPQGKKVPIEGTKQSWHFDFTEENYDRVSQQVVDYLLTRFTGRNAAESRESIYEVFDSFGSDRYNAVSVLNRIEFPEILQMAVPDSLNDFLQDQLGDRRSGRIISATSLGPMFVTLNPEDRRQMLYRLALGANGFFEEKNFADSGSKILESFIELSTRESVPAVGAEQVTQQWNPREVDTAKKVLKTAFESLEPGRRAEVFARIINLIIDSGGEVSKEQVIKTALTSFGVVGAKVGQMDQLLPEYLREGLGSLKEQVPPLPKTTVAQVLRKSGRDHYYEGLGSSIGAASTATVYLARRPGVVEEDRVIKVLRPDALKHVDSDLNAVRSVVTTLRDSGALSVDPTQVIEELRSMITEEFNPRNEQKNIQDIEQGRRRPAIKRKALEVLRIKQPETPTRVTVPQVDFAGDAHLEMSRALGMSLARVEEVKTKAGRGEVLTEEEIRFAQVDLKAVHEAVVSDFFEQAFTTAAFHTDLHPGNIFIDPNGDITEIDHGQVGRERAGQRRKALVEFSVGLARNEPRLVARAISKFAPTMTVESIQNALSVQQATTNNLLNTTTGFISNNNIQGSINRFTKAMVNVYPYMRDLDEVTLRNIMLPYVADAAVIFDLEKAVPGMVTEPVKEVIATKLAPVIDEVSRLDRVRQDPAMREALDAALKTSVGVATIGADIAYLLGKGETVMGMPVPKAIRPVWKVVGLLSGRDKQGRAALAQALRLPSETAKNVQQFRETVTRLRQRYADEKSAYLANKQQIDEALQDFQVEPPQGGLNG